MQSVKKTIRANLQDLIKLPIYFVFLLSQCGLGIQSKIKLDFLPLV
jgi:hypothetical protein